MSRWTCLALVSALALGAAACGKKEGGGGTASGGKSGKPGGSRGPVKFPVQVMEVAAKDVEYSVSAVGTVEAFEVVQVTARVQGVVEKVNFAEGLEVKKGQVLAEIEPARYQLAVDSARAALSQALAQSEEAKAALERRESVNQATPGLIPGEELESFRTRSRTAAAEAEARRVGLEQAKLNLRDAYVRAPAAGVLQTRTVQTGQFVQPGAVLASLVQREPLLLRFKVSELEAARLEVGAEARFTTRDAEEPFVAKLTHVGQAADPQSRMVNVTAEVTDERREVLRPGAFAQVTVPISASRAPVIPQTAVRPSERGFLAYVVDTEKEVAHERVVQLGMRTTGGMVEVKEGLRAGDKLVIRGAEALREGAPVRVADGPGADITDDAAKQGAAGQRGTGTGRPDAATPRGAP